MGNYNVESLSFVVERQKLFLALIVLTFRIKGKFMKEFMYLPSVKKTFFISYALGKPKFFM
jgi:hypothetical protein